MNGQKGPLLPSAKRVSVREFRDNFADFMRQVRQGSSFTLTSRDEVIAYIWPIQPQPTFRRQPGALSGKIQMSLDFDALPPDLLATFENVET